MKKFLLFAAAALSVASVSAQKLTTKKGQSKAQSSMVMPMLETHQLDASEIKAATKAMPRLADLTSKKSVVNSFKKVETRTFSQTRADVQEYYTATGVDPFDKTKLNWTMLTGKAEDGTLLLADVIPNDWPDVVDYIAVEYTIEDNVITIAPQPIGLSTGTVDLWICSYTSDDGSIKMKLGEDGSLELSPKNDIVLYVGFATGMPFDPELEAGFDGLYSGAQNITYYRPGEGPQISEIKAEYEPEGLYLHMGLSRSFYGYNNNLAMMPAYAPVRFKNFTGEDMISYTWSAEKLEYDANAGSYVSGGVETADTYDFVLNTNNGVYSPIKLVGKSGDVEGSYTWGTQLGNKTVGYVYAGASADSYEMSDGTFSIITKCNPDFQIAYYGFIGTPDVNSNNYSIRNLYLYQGKPAAPLFCEGITYLVRDFAAKDKFELTCQIRKFTRSESGAGSIGDVLYESSSVEFVEGGSAGIGEIQFKDFYTYDEDGMTVNADYMFIEDEFCVAILGWDNGTFSCNPFGEYDYNENGITSTFFNFTPSNEYTGEELYRFGSLYSRQYIGFIGAAYGYLRTEQSTDLAFSEEGGAQSITVEPMLCSVDASSGEYTTRLFIDENTEIPEWVEIGIANESYEDSFSFDLVVACEPLPAGETGRSAVITLWQEGAKLTLNITQGAGSGIDQITVSSSKTGKTFNLVGQPVGKNYKGIVVRNGEKHIQK